jgi:hypothetical protein
MSKTEIIQGLEKFRPIELGDDPMAWRQSDTLDRVIAYLNEVMN